jgi:hypothetical protein
VHFVIHSINYQSYVYIYGLSSINTNFAEYTVDSEELSAFCDYEYWNIQNYQNVMQENKNNRHQVYF